MSNAGSECVVVTFGCGSGEASDEIFHWIADLGIRAMPAVAGLRGFDMPVLVSCHGPRSPLRRRLVSAAFLVLN